MEVEALGLVVPEVGPLEDEGVEVDVESKVLSAELDDRDDAGAGAGPDLALVEGGEDAEEGGQDGAAQVAAVGDACAQREGKGEHPLADAVGGQDPVDEVGGALGHLPGVARGAESAVLAREGHDAGGITVGAAEQREARGLGDAAQQVVLELPADVRRQEAAVGLGAVEEGVEVAVEHPVQGVFAAPRGGVCRHAAPGEQGACRGLSRLGRTG